MSCLRARSLCALALVGASLAQEGCAVQAGGHLGFRTGRVEDTSDFPFSASWGSHADAMLLVPVAGPNRRLVLGTGVEAQAVEKEGSEWLLRARAGFQWAPRSYRWAAGFEVTADLATPLRDGVLLPDGEWQLGPTLSLPLWLGPSRTAASENRSPWYAAQVPMIVPYLRARMRRELLPGALADSRHRGLQTRWDIGLGLALRLQLESDLL